LVAAAKAQPGKMAYGSSGPGGPLHLGMEMFKSAAGIDIFHVPYKGNAPMNVALLSGEIPIAMDTLAISLPHIKANKYKALAVTSTKRLSLIPEVPTLAEAGLPGFDYEGWQGIFVPASTPTAVVTQLNAALVKVLAQPALRQRLIDLGYEPKSSSAAEMGATLAKDLSAYRKVITDAKIKVD
jgi:tripartite-type tricarboxylate transporter receptor subunit TctC